MNWSLSRPVVLADQGASFHSIANTELALVGQALSPAVLIIFTASGGADVRRGHNLALSRLLSAATRVELAWYGMRRLRFTMTAKQDL